jgi:hypothetical protein
MKFFSIIALAGLAQALTLNQLNSAEPAAAEPAAEPSAAAGTAKPEAGSADKKAAPAAPAAEAEAGAPKPAAEVVDKEAVAEADKKAAEAPANGDAGGEAVADAAAAKAGKPIDVSDAPTAPPKKAEPEREYTAAEKTRNHILKIASTGQNAIESNDGNLKDIADKYAPKPKIEKDSSKSKEGFEDGSKDQAEFEKKAAALEAQGVTTEAEKWTANMNNHIQDGDNKKAILQTTNV